MWYKKNKYNAKKTEYNGRIYHSKKEALYAQQLDILLKSKQIKSFRPQVKISIDIDGIHICNHIVDFEIVTNANQIEWHEVKGFETAVYKLKKKILHATILKHNKGIKYIIVK
jgi:hypothetical protein